MTKLQIIQKLNETDDFKALGFEMLSDDGQNQWIINSNVGGLSLNRYENENGEVFYDDDVSGFISKHVTICPKKIDIINQSKKRKRGTVMSTINKKAKDLQTEIRVYGTATIQPGIYIELGGSLADQAEDWSDSDPAKDVDFSMYPFWLTTDTGTIPEGFDTIQEVLDSQAWD